MDPSSLGPDQMVIDLTDPNRPRFTLQELRDVLQERNQLKAQLLVVQEELQCYKSGIISQKRDQTEELEKEARGSSAGTSKDSEEKTIIKRLFSFKHVVQQFFTCLNVPGSYEDEMRHTIDVVQLGLTIATLAVINEPPQTIRFFRSIDTERARTEGGIAPGTGAPLWTEPKHEMLRKRFVLTTASNEP
ncbi:hypothetical protein IHE44_0006346 [Lamprotornis superbus]|uniref:RH2 domain-containing protein n=1 Tax=Lamprotornis superbus TaxID=245042 RepID=A0A835U091_9PASS|nr:hypothetical protein IHE44_0006346 [Lamprotornis superbus]